MSEILNRNFENRVVLVTGGNKGVGKGIALEFARRGAKVVIGYNSNPEMAQSTLSEINSISQGIAIHADLESPEGCRSLVEGTIAEYKNLDVLVNNAALQTHYSLLESNLAVYQKHININLRGYYLMTKYSHEYIKNSDQGRIIYITSIHGKRPLTYDAAYAVSKGGIEMLMREAALEFAPDGITVNSIAPGGVYIENKSGNPRPMSFKGGIKRKLMNPLGRLAYPADVGKLACFLASDEAEHINGTTIRVDGGYVLV